MNSIKRSDKLQHVHSDIRGPVYFEALRMQREGIQVLRLNTGNPGSFRFQMPDSIRQALEGQLDRAVPYCDLKGMPEAREAICAYHKKKGFQDVTPDDIFIGNGVSELVPMALTALLNFGDEILIPSPDYSLWTNSAWMSGAVPVYYVCDEQANWFPDPADIRRKMRIAASKGRQILQKIISSPSYSCIRRSSWRRSWKSPGNTIWWSSPTRSMTAW